MASLSPALFRRGSIYHYRFRMDGKTHQQSTHESIRGEAEAVAWRAFEAAKSRARGEEPDIKLQELGRLWLEINRGVKADSYVESVERFVRRDLGDLAGIRCGDLTTDRVEKARSAYIRDGHVQSSADTWLGKLKMLASWAVRRRAIVRLPFDVKKLGYQKVPRTILPVASRREWFDHVERASIAEPAIGVVIEFMLEMGLRQTEAIGARWEWLDPVRKTYTPGKTKGKEAWPRSVPDVLWGRMGDPKAKGLIAPRADGRPVSVGQIDRVMRRANAEFGIVRLTPHSLRRTYATHLHDAGVPLDDIRRALGHKSVNTTIAYIHSDQERVREAQNYFSEIAKSECDKTSATPPANPR